MYRGCVRRVQVIDFRYVSKMATSELVRMYERFRLGSSS
jgi:hypothetical protein